MEAKTINDVKKFWEKNPLFSGESQQSLGTMEFFEEHKKLIIEDCFAGHLDPKIFPKPLNQNGVLDLGCGPGFWLVELANIGCKNIVGVDLTFKGLELAKKRTALYGTHAKLSQQNAEKLAFRDETFSHVHCNGVIHHTPDTQACVREISRVLKEHGTATISVYYKNIFLRWWALVRFAGKLVYRLNGKLKGRGRENIYSVDSVKQIVRLYDGDDNPIGKAYTENEFKEMVLPFFHVEDIFYYFFPARTLPFKLPKMLHRFLSKNTGFIIVATLKKK